MAGKKQHFIQKSFVKNFSKEPNAYNPKIWVYTNYKDPYFCGIKDAPAAKYFYSELSTTTDKLTLDDKITKYECEVINPYLQILKTMQDNPNVDSIIPATVIAHFIIRNNHFRLVAEKYLTKGFGSFLKNFSSKQNCLNFFISGLLQKKEKIDILIGDQNYLNCNLNSNFLRVLSKGFINDIISLLQDSETSYLIEDANEHIRQTIDLVQVFLDVPSMHKKILTENLNGIEFAKKLKRFNWFFVPFSQELILPDCIAVAKVKGHYNSILNIEIDEADTILWPISTHTLLIGTFNSNAIIPDDINRVLAINCAEFFIAADIEPNLCSLKTLISHSLNNTINIDIEKLNQRLIEMFFSFKGSD